MRTLYKYVTHNVYLDQVFIHAGIYMTYVINTSYGTVVSVYMYCQLSEVYQRWREHSDVGKETPTITLSFKCSFGEFGK